MLKIPFSLLPVKALKSFSRPLTGAAQKISKFFPFLEVNLIRADSKIDEKEYVAMCLASNIFFFVFISFFISLILSSADVKVYYLIGPLIGLVFSFFVFIEQMFYPKLIANKKTKNIDQNLLAALQSMLVQFNSGVPLFNILVNISKGNYGEVSKEFGKAIKEMNAGKPQLEALEDIATKNPSLFFRRAIWQIINGMKSGADISNVMEEVIRLLSEEQVIQIQNYGSQLNPLAMFYMLIAVIIPSLSITFLIILSSFIAMSEEATKMLFFGLYGAVLFLQIIFLGIIKSRRPNLAAD